MKIEIDRDILQALIRSASPAVARSTTIPALKCYHLRAWDDTVQVSATDAVLHCEAKRAGVKVMRPGMCLVDAALLDSVAKLAPSGAILIAADRDGVVIKSPGGRYKAPAHELDHFPGRSDPQAEPVTFEVTAGSLLQLFDRVQFAASRKESASEKFLTTGIQLELSGTELTAAATDTVRLATATTRLASPVADVKGLIPPSVIAVARGAFQDPAETIRVSLWQTSVRFQGGCATTQSPLLSGRYPLWRLFIERMGQKHPLLTDHPGNLLAAVRRVSVTADDTNSPLDLTANGRLTLSLSLSGRAGEGEVEHICQGGQFDNVTTKTRLYPDHLKEWLQLASSEGIEEIQFAPGDGKKAAYLGAGPDWTYLTMPMVKPK